MILEVSLDLLHDSITEEIVNIRKYKKGVEKSVCQFVGPLLLLFTHVNVLVWSKIT